MRSGIIAQFRLTHFPTLICTSRSVGLAEPPLLTPIWQS
jgi:hypothetical protein